jgi:hypothetical protein
MFPAGAGSTSFINQMVTDANGNAQTLKYGLLTLSGVAAEVPRNCGYGGTTAGSSFTLIYGMGGATDSGLTDGSVSGGGVSDAPVSDGRTADSRPADGGGILDASIDASGHAGSTGSDGSSASDGTHDALAASDAASGQGGFPGTGGQTNSGVGGNAGSLGTGGRAAPDAMAEAGEGNTVVVGSADTGCSCSTAPGLNRNPWLAVIGSALIGWVVRRRRERGSRTP